MDHLMQELSERIVERLQLDDVDPRSIDVDAPLFGEGLSLDSIDAVDLVVMLEKHYRIRLTEIETAKEAFASIRTLAAFVTNKGCAASG